MGRDGWWWLSSPTVTVAVLIKDGQIVKGPPIIWRRQINFDRWEFLGE